MRSLIPLNHLYSSSNKNKKNQQHTIKNYDIWNDHNILQLTFLYHFILHSSPPQGFYIALLPDMFKETHPEDGASVLNLLRAHLPTRMKTFLTYSISKASRNPSLKTRHWATERLLGHLCRVPAGACTFRRHSRHRGNCTKYMLYVGLHRTAAASMANSWVLDFLLLCAIVCKDSHRSRKKPTTKPPFHVLVESYA